LRKIENGIDAPHKPRVFPLVPVLESPVGCGAKIHDPVAKDGNAVLDPDRVVA
jgi:hypothetical protein